MAVSRTTHGGFLNYASRPGNPVDVAQCVWHRRCTPDVTLSSIHYIRKLTLHHIMAYDHQPHHITPLYHSFTPTRPHQINYLNNPTRLLGLLSAYMRPADLLCMLSTTCQAHIHVHMFFVRMSHVVSDFDSSLESYFVFRLFVFVNSLFRHVSSSFNSMLLVGLSVCFSRFVCF